MLRKVFNFFRNNKKKLITIAIVLAFLVALSIISMLVLQAFGVIYYDDDGMKLNNELFNNFINSWYGWVILLLLQVAITSLLCFIPGASMAFILLIQALFSKPWQAFILAFSGVVLSSMIMYLIGRLGGYRICEKLLGKEDCQKASDLLNHKGVIYFPLMMMFPIFPDDALVMIAGTLKMSMKWFTPSILIGRGIGVATIIFGISSIPYEKFETPLHWIGFIITCAILIIAVFYLAHLFNKFLNKRTQKKDEVEKNVISEARKLCEQLSKSVASEVAENTDEFTTEYTVTEAEDTTDTKENDLPSSNSISQTETIT